jgi:membrane associated rhomboid family serine protease
MTEILYKIIFSGKLLYGFKLEEVRANLARLGKYDEKALDKLFSGREIIIKNNLSLETARRYKNLLDKTGARCDIMPVASTLIEKLDVVGILPKEPTGFPCPKCGAAQQTGASCEKCGILFAKYEQAQQRRAEQPEPGPATNPTEQSYFARHQEQLFILKVFAVIIGIICLQKFLSGLIGVFLLLFPVLFLFFVKMQAAASGESTFDILKQHITFMPVMYTEGERKKDGVAWATYGLILVNILIFYLLETPGNAEFIGNNLLFIPHQPTAWNIPISLFTSLFLHSSNAHLWGNMLFLWAVGTVIEKRIGWIKHLGFYLLAGTSANLLALVVYRLFLHETLHILGASGAIAGVMGVYAVRCYFKSMVFPLPILGIFSLILPLSLKVRLNSLVIIGLFFLADLSGGIGQLGGEASHIGHWAHIGGMLCGIGLATLFKLNLQAIEERHLEIGSAMVHHQKLGMDMATGEESLRLLLQQNPQNADALLLLAKLKTKFSAPEDGAELYLQAIAQLLKQNRLPEAADAFQEFHRLYRTGIEANQLYRLAAYYSQKQELENASRCLELLCHNQQTPPQVLEKSLYQYARTLDRLGFAEVARDYYRRVIELFPDSPFCEKIRAQR